MKENKFVKDSAWKALSRLYWDRGNYDEALEAFEHYMAGKGSLVMEDQVFLGSLMIAAGRKDEGFSWFDKAKYFFYRVPNACIPRKVNHIHN